MDLEAIAKKHAVESLRVFGSYTSNPQQANDIDLVELTKIQPGPLATEIAGTSRPLYETTAGRHFYAETIDRLLDLKPHVTASRAKQDAAHYEIERQVQLAVELSLSIGRRVLSERGLTVPDSGAGVFFALKENGFLESTLAEKIALTVGLRNLIVHEYGASLNSI